MFKIEDTIGDVILISFKNYEDLKDFGITAPAAHYLVKGIDQVGLWLEHPGIILSKTEDKDGKPIPEDDIVREKVEANFLVRWDNIKSVMHYPDREGYDFPSEFSIDVGFKK